MSIEWISHKGNKILYVKYTGLSPEAMRDQVKSATQTIIDTKSDQNLVLTDMQECFVDEAFLELSKQQGKLSLPHCSKSAIVGLTGVKKLLLKGVNAFTPKAREPFDTIEEAKEWLVK